jgi:hypothetical protein
VHSGVAFQFICQIETGIVEEHPCVAFGTIPYRTSILKFKLLPLPLFLVMALTAPGIHAAVSYAKPESIYT